MKPRGPDKKPRSTAARKQAAEYGGGVTPLDILLTTMRDTWAEAEKHRLLAADMDRPDLVLSEMAKVVPLRAYACQLAEKAAPYVHARLASTTVNATVRRRVTDLSTDELIALTGDDDGEIGIEPAPDRPH